MNPSQTRFEALDAWRGISACFVVLFHLEAHSHFYQLPLLRHSFLFVDFFFVLSGFVITANYRSKLLSGFSFWHFMFLRFGRLYPLHLATLLAFIGLELARYQFSGFLGGDPGNRFSGSTSIAAIFTNALLIQSLGVHEMLTWNFPSWSISTEFYAYAIFASVLLALQRWIYVFVIFVFVAAPVFLLVFVGHIDSQYDFGIIRCVFGFFVGFACYDLYLIIGARTKIAGLPSTVICSCLEALCVGVVVFFVCFCSSGPFSLAAPWVFGLTVLTFSFQRGVISKVLEAQPFLFVGALSYSIYMVHWLVDVGMQYALRLAQREWGINLFYEGRIGAYMWQGDMAYGFTLLLVISISYLTFKFIEEPGRRQTRLISNMIFPATESSSFPQTNRYTLQNLSPSDRSKSQRAKNHATPL